MIVLFIVVCLVVAFLILLMFLILRKTVRIVNEQTKSYFVNKLQGFDDLITERELKLNEIDELIKSRELGKEENKKELSKGGYAFDTSVINLFNSTQYQDKNVFELNRKIDENFVVNYEELVKDFLTFCEDNKDYEFCLKLRDKFDSEKIYNLKSMMELEMEEEYYKGNKIAKYSTKGCYPYSKMKYIKTNQINYDINYCRYNSSYHNKIRVIYR